MPASDPVAILGANLEALRPASVRQIVATASASGWRADFGVPWPMLAMEVAPGHWTSLHDAADPIGEAAEALERKRAGRPWPGTVVLLGAGLGYAVDAIERAAPPGTRVLVIEPFAAAAQAMLARRDWRPLLDSGRLRLLVGPDYLGAADAWRLFPAGDAPPLIVPLAPLLPPRAPDVVLARRLFDRVYLDATANAEARRKLGGRYLVNTLANLPRLLRAPDLRQFVASRTGQPAVVCGAGPSLNENLRALASRRDRVVLIAADTALRPVLDAGLEPDFVVALDPSVVNARHLSELPNLSRAWLVSEAALDPSAFGAFGDRVAFFRVGQNDPWPWLGPFGIDAPVLAAWGSVLTSAFEFATWLGCNPVLFMGADLAYTGNRTYARGTTYELDWARFVLEGQRLPEYFQRNVARVDAKPAAGVAGEVPTTKHLIAFRDWLVERVAGGSTRVVNLTGGGVLIGPGIEQQPPAYLDRFQPLAPPAAPAGRDTPSVDHAALASAAAAVTADSEPLAGWLTRCAGNVDRDALADALGAIAQQVEVPAVRPDRATVKPALAGVAESVAALGAARRGTHPPAWSTESETWKDRTAATPTVTEAFVNLLGEPRLTVPGGAGHPLPIADGGLHDLFVLDWQRAPHQEVATLANAAADRLRAAPQRRRVRQRHLPVRPRGADTIARPARTPGEAERRARLLATSLWTLGAATEVPDVPAWRKALDVIDIGLAAAQEPPPIESPGAIVMLAARTAMRRWRMAVPLSPRRRADVFGGGLFVEDTTSAAGAGFDFSHDGVRVSVDARLSAIARATTPDGLRAIDWAPALELTRRGLPPCLVGSAADETAIVTPRGQHASFEVGSDGRFVRTAGWPEPIVGELRTPHGDVAWTTGAPASLLHRTTPDAPATAVPLPFQPYGGRWHDGELLLAGSDGLWSWVPGEAPRRRAALPPCQLVAADGDDVHLDPVPVRDGRLAVERLESGWIVHLRTGTADAHPLPRPGQRWSVANHRQAIATTFPESDWTRIERTDGGHTIWLWWPRPRMAMWLDDSLVVNTAAGEVVLFPNLIARLTAIDGRRRTQGQPLAAGVPV